MGKISFSNPYGLIYVLIFLINFSIICMPGAAISSDDQSQDVPTVLIRTDNSKYIAGEKINISITVKDMNELPVEPILQYRVVYVSLNMTVVKGVVARDIQPNYTYNSFKTLPDYAPPGRYNIVASLVSNEGNVLGSASSELVIEPNYAGIAGSFAIFLLYASSVIMLCWLLFYCRRYEQGDQ